MKWIKRVKLLKISGVAIAVCLVFLTIFAGFTVYGNKVGNFVINVSDSEVKLSLSQYDDLRDPATRLAVKGLPEQGAASFADIPADIWQGVGAKSDAENLRYLAFGFYLINNSDRATDYEMTLKISEVSEGVEKAVRVAVWQEDLLTDIYALAEANDADREWLESHVSYRSKDFLTTTEICRETTTNFRKSAVVKYTVVVWIEGWDVDCTDDLIGGKIKINMEFRGF